MKYQIFVNRKKNVSIELKISSLMSLKMFTFFLRAFSDTPGVECSKWFQVYRTSIFFVNYSENHRIIPGGSMWQVIGRGMPNILLFILYHEG